ncbi:HAD family hydrolase [Corticicoccus populi]|uniref:HAD family hydrolase n=1 Tax=Corticicoccus populi TaxID=1812821 RepID=A0ABW5WT92_9STAP
MKKYKAVIFDLDDTLLDRNVAVDELLYLLVEKYYNSSGDIDTDKMLYQFRHYDKENFGKADKTKVLEPFFETFPPDIEMDKDEMMEFWNTYFPKCFKADQETLSILDKISSKVKMAIVTNGTSERQNAKIKNSGLDAYFKTILISEEAGVRKPDRRIFDMVLNHLELEAGEVLFIGDHLEWDVEGSQNAGMNDVWFNPLNHENNTHIHPSKEIKNMGDLLKWIE